MYVTLCSCDEMSKYSMTSSWFDLLHNRRKNTWTSTRERSPNVPEAPRLARYCRHVWKQNWEREQYVTVRCQKRVSPFARDHKSNTCFKTYPLYRVYIYCSYFNQYKMSWRTSIDIMVFPVVTRIPYFSWLLGNSLFQFNLLAYASLESH